MKPFRKKGNTEGRKFVVETFFAKQARKINLTLLQRTLVLGSLLGDGYLMPTTSGYCFRVNHGLQQQEYVDWKFNLLSDFVRTPPQKSGRCYYFRTITHSDFVQFRSFFYVDNRKIVPVEFLYKEFTELSLAVWIMDDGAADGKQLRINTQSFTFSENEALISFLRAKFGIEARLNQDKGRPRLRITAASMERLKKLVKPHIIPNMLYKFSL